MLSMLLTHHRHFCFLDIYSRSFFITEIRSLPKRTIYFNLSLSEAAAPTKAELKMEQRSALLQIAATSDARQ